MILLVAFFLSSSHPTTAGDYRVRLTETRSIDGTGNSIGGDAGTPLHRKTSADYPGDGSGDSIVEWPDRENPRTISNVVNQQASSQYNDRSRSDYLWAWGQFVDHDIDLTEASSHNGTADIDIINPTDLLYPGPLFFNRSNFQPGTGTAGTPRQHMNDITAFIDASNVYGSDDKRAVALRTFVSGKLKTSDGDLLPFNLSGLPNAGGPDPSLFLAGDVRANENILLSSLHTLFVREHNRLATLIALRDPLATDEEIYQLARKIVGAEMQLVTYQEFLPALLGPAAPNVSSAAYDSAVDSSINNEFSTALYRFGHSMLSANLQLAGGEQIALRNAFFRPDSLVADPTRVDRLLMGAQGQACQEIDTLVVEDVRSFLFGPPGSGGLDLAALNIQRGRDHGIPPYNALRVAYGLPAVSDFSDITSNTETQSRLSQVYADVDEIDAWVGGLAEDHLPGASVGPLLTAGISDQFVRLLKGDRFSMLNDADLRQDLVRAIVDLPRLSLNQIIHSNTTSSLVTDDIFSVEDAFHSDVITSYDPQNNCLHIQGNDARNRLTIVELALGFWIKGQAGTKIDGRPTKLVTTGRQPHLTIDLGGGDDNVSLLFCEFSDVTIATDDGNDVVSAMLVSADSFYVDFGDGRDRLRRTWTRVPRGNSRVLNVP
ncbi:MAG: peroxidase [Planctomycetaceae bacterium]|nr:peroxidase [Planctomycetaceae bacterium]